MKRCLLITSLLLAGCQPHVPPPAGYAGAPVPLAQNYAAAAPRQSGALDNEGALPPPVASYRQAGSITTAAPRSAAAPGDISLDFADTDIRTVVAQILGTILQQNYTIDTGVQGTATLQTVTPLSRDQLIPTLQTLLAQNNAVLVRQNGIYRVMMADQAAAAPNLTTDSGLGGGTVVALHYAQAAPLATMLEPYVSGTSRLVPSGDQNAIIVQGDPSSRQALVNLIEAFDVDQLAGQSYELFPVTGGDAHDFATAFTTALGHTSDPSEPAPITVVPLERINAVLVIARTESLLADAQRVYAVLDQSQRENLRSWHVYYLHNGRSNDAAYILQQAFTPDDVTAQPTPQATGQISTVLSSQSDNGGAGSSSTSAGGLIGSSVTSAAGGSSASGSAAGASALLGPLSSGANANVSTDAIRIIPDDANNSLMIYASADEDDRIDAMLDKIDIQPVEVRIDATIAEVDLDSALQYGTQFFFKSGDINAVLSTGTTAALDTTFPGFVLSGAGSNAAPLAISMLQSVTKVNVLSSPELMVLDGQPASLQVGALVPYLTQTSQETTVSNAPVINSIDYRETGVILQVTPHVGTNGMVTLDVAQEVSGVQSTLTTAGINSPTFTERAVTSRVAIQDGQTIGLAGLISDNDSHANAGIPFLKNIPLLGDLTGSQNNSRTRTELLVLITPHVIRSQQDAADLTLDMQEQLPNAAKVPNLLQQNPPGGSADPDAPLRADLPPP